MLIEEARQKISTTKIVNRLTSHALGECDMTPTQVSAALGLLRKTIPDLQSVEATVEGETVHRVVADKPMAEDEWEKRYGDSLATATGAAESIN